MSPMLITHRAPGQKPTTAIALIPARSGSKRIPGKNMKLLHGQPLVAYTIVAALQSQVFSQIIVSSDDEATLQLALSMGVGGIRRPAKYASDDSPDVEWVKHALTSEAIADQQHECFAILRPTSPFRTAATIQRAWAEYERSACDSLRAVEVVKANPHKMFWLVNCELQPILASSDNPPWHSRPTQTLPWAVQQNASLEISRCSHVRDRLFPSITGPRIWGFLNPEPEGFDINDQEQWDKAERKIAEGAWTLPTI
jgi:CMP-N,N'-diacetyllegionaminic acid synthase